MADKRISQLVDRGTIANNDVVPIVVSGASTTNKATISSIQTFMQGNLDLGVTSVGLSMPSAFVVTNSPVTSSGNISVTGAGTVSQYIRGDGSLADFPSGGGGGSAVNYYLNGSVSQGTIGGIAYQEMNKTPVLGAGTDFTIAADGYIASFITDAGDPALLEIPAGNWNFETYLQASSGGGTPSFYIELYKVNSGGTATLIASNSATPELIAFGTTTTPYFSALAVPTTSLTLTDRLALRYYVTHSGRTITLHTENSNLCQIITTFTTGLTALNGLTAQVQNFATGTSGTDFAISSSVSTHTFNLPNASATARGVVSTGSQTFAGVKTFSSDIIVNGVNIGLGAGSIDTNTRVGTAALFSNTTGFSNVALGRNALTSNTTGVDNTALGYNALYSGATSSYNTAVGSSALEGITSGGNVAVGNAAGRLTTANASNITSTNSIYIGNDSSPSASGNTNEIIIGHSADGNGSNSVTIGNSSTTNNYFTGNIRGGAFIKSGGTSSQFLKADGSVDSSTYLTTGSAASTYLPLAGGTLTGALNGTSASFSGKGVIGGTQLGVFTPYSQLTIGSTSTTNVSLTIASTNSSSGLLEFADGVTGNEAYRGYIQYNHQNDSMNLATSGQDRLTLSSTGAATFSSSVTATRGLFTIANNSGVDVRSGNSSNYTYIGIGRNILEASIGIPSASDQFMTGSAAGDITIQNTSGKICLGTAEISRLAITNAGNVGIGTASPPRTLSIQSTDVWMSYKVTGDREYLIGMGTSDALRFYDRTAETERMRITSGGYLKASNTGTYLNSTSPYHEIVSNQAGANPLIFTHTHSSDTYGPYVFFQNVAPNNSTNYFLSCGDNAGDKFIARSNGGLANFQANNTNLSDERTKKDIEPLESYWDKFKAIEIVKFKYKDQTHDDFNIGVIAQQVESVAPEFVDVDGWDTKPKLDEEGNEIISEEEPLKSIYTADLHHATIKVLQEAMAKIEKLETEIDSLKNQIK